VITRVRITVHKQFQRKVRRSELRSIAKTAVKIGWENSTKSNRVSVVITDDKTIKLLNTNYRNISEITDVLAFPNYKLVNSQLVSLDDFPTVTNAYLELGEIVISYPQVIRQALNNGNSPSSEFALLTAHGILHLLGYDHENIDNKNHMWRLQNNVLSSNGIDFKKP